MATVKKSVAKSAFKPNEHVVYPAHGVGVVKEIQRTEFGGHPIELIVVTFAKDKMTLRVPVAKANSVGMRKLSDPKTMQKALEVVTGRARVKRTMWSRRAQEYEAKINSGDLIAIAEVVRDLYRAENQPEQSYSERQLYEAALDRMAREVAAINKSDEAAAIKVIEAQLAKAPKRPAKGAEDEADEDGEELQDKAA
ncbi:MAG: CarD family transcriptional regulator [Pseudomonadota bacterium]